MSKCSSCKKDFTPLLKNDGLPYKTCDRCRCVVGGLAWIFDRGVFLLCALGLSAFVASTSMLAMHRLLTQRQLGSAPFLLHEQHLHERHEQHCAPARIEDGAARRRATPWP